MWVSRSIALTFFALFAIACGGKSIKTIGGEAGGGGQCEDTECDRDCVDTSNDPRNCGECFRQCDSDEACVGGTCQPLPICDPPTTFCNRECVDLRSSNEHCGGCGFACGFGSTCQNGGCVPQCPGGQCGNLCVDFSSDPANCGGCGFVCGPSQFCSGGVCFESCQGPFVGNCNGVCVDLSSDTFNCGGCGFVCPSDAQCAGGSCIPFCPMGTLCGMECVDTSSNPNHCGGCFNTCGMPNRCVGGICTGAGCGNRVVEPGEEADPPPGPLPQVPLDPRTCRYDFSRINQLYCAGTCGNWGGDSGCDQGDADAFCRLKMDNPRSVAVTFSVVPALHQSGICCPPPSFPDPSTLGCTALGTLASRGVTLNVSVHPTNLFSTHMGGDVITNAICTDP
jgi:hypothetical protein